MFTDKLEDGIWKPVFAQCIFRPAAALAKYLYKEFVFQSELIGTMKPGAYATKDITFRFQCILMAELVACVRNNSRFLSVSTHMKTYCPKLFRLLYKQCSLPKSVQVTLTDFRVASKNGNQVEPATNIGPLMALLQFLYVEDRRYIYYYKTHGVGAAKKEVECHAVKQNYDYEIFKEWNNKEELDKGTWFTVVNPIRKKLLALREQTEKDETNSQVGGKVKVSKTNTNYGKRVDAPWDELRPKFFLEGMEVEDAMYLGQFLHCITTGGFVSAEEESKHFATHKTLFDNQSQRPDDPIARRILSVINFWNKVDKNCTLFNSYETTTKRKGLSDKILIDRVLKLHNSGFKFELHFSGIEDLKDPEVTKTARFPKKVIDESAKEKKGDHSSLKSLAHTSALVLNRACLHLAAATLTSPALKYDKKKHLCNDNQDKQRNFAEGELIIRLAELEVQEKIKRNKELLTFHAESIQNQSGIDPEIRREYFSKTVCKKYLIQLFDQKSNSLSIFCCARSFG